MTRYPDADEPGSADRREAAAAEGATATSVGAPAGNRPSTPTSSTGAAPGAGGPTSGAAASGGTLRAGQSTLLPVPAGGLAALAGQTVTGQGVLVESVVGDEAFWVGSSATDRVLVHLSEQARTAAGESPFQVAAGQRVDLEGVLQPLAAASEFGVDEAEGAAQLQSIGHYIEATRIALR